VHLRNTGWWSAGAGIRTDVTTRALIEVLKEIARMAETPVTSDELALAKESLVGVLPSRFTTTEQTVGMLSDLFTYDLGTDYFSRFIPRVQAATIDSIREISRKYLLQAKPLVVLIGDKKKIDGELRKLELNPIEEWDAAGKVVPVQ
jgi:zinc protease